MLEVFEAEIREPPKDLLLHTDNSASCIVPGCGPNPTKSLSLLRYVEPTGLGDGGEDLLLFATRDRRSRLPVG